MLCIIRASSGVVDVKISLQGREFTAAASLLCELDHLSRSAPLQQIMPVLVSVEADSEAKLIEFGTSILR